jgi:hypothetical protein
MVMIAMRIEYMNRKEQEVENAVSILIIILLVIV